jgi:hypothetical protein
VVPSQSNGYSVAIDRSSCMVRASRYMLYVKIMSSSTFLNPKYGSEHSYGSVGIDLTRNASEIDL